MKIQVQLLGSGAGNPLPQTLHFLLPLTFLVVVCYSVVNVEQDVTNFTPDVPPNKTPSTPNESSRQNPELQLCSSLWYQSASLRFAFCFYSFCGVEHLKKYGQQKCIFYQQILTCHQYCQIGSILLPMCRKSIIKVYTIKHVYCNDSALRLLAQTCGSTVVFPQCTCSSISSFSA